MAGALESEATFRQRALVIGLTEAACNQMVAKGYSSMARLAFASNYHPGSPDEKPFVDLVADILGAPPDGPTLSCFRRLYFEAFTLSAADLKARLEKTDDMPPRRLAAPERAHRYQLQCTKLQGLDLTGELEASDSLVDKCVQQHDDNRLAYIDWNACTKKSQEITGIRKESFVRPNASGALVLAPELSGPTADTSSELMLKAALTRRGLAYDQAMLISFSVHSSWIEDLFRARLAEPLEHYKQVGIQQLYNADKAIFVRMAEKCRAGIIPTPAGVWPLDAAMKEAMLEPRLVMLLSPLPAGAGPAKPALVIPGPTGALVPFNTGPMPPTPGSKRQIKLGKKRARSAAAAFVPPAPAPTGTPRPGKGSGKGIRMPAGLEGMVSRTADGKPICWGFNLGTCSAAGDSCGKGMHVCCAPGCGAKHPLAQHI